LQKLKIKKDGGKIQMQISLAAEKRGFRGLQEQRPKMRGERAKSADSARSLAASRFCLC
jgi:hypothetical protein